MNCKITVGCFLALVVAWCGIARAEEAPSEVPKPIPQTRPEMKKAIDILKQRKSRLPLPAVTAEEKANAGERMLVNNGRLRGIYLPKEWMGAQGGGGNRQPDPAMTLDNTFKVRLFWIVSRANNCHYCLGHQEMKLRNAGMAEDAIAALDCDWSVFPENERGAMELARKITLAPHKLTAEELDKLRSQYTDTQWIELVQTVASYNSTNRWTDSTGIPQDQAFGETPTLLDTPTSPDFQNRPTQIFAIVEVARPAIESRSVVEEKLAECRKRTPRAALLSEEKARAVLPPDWSGAPLPQWIRALANLPQMCAQQAKSRKAFQETGRISPKLKGEIAWIAARQNRAWYSAGQAMKWLKEQGLTADEIFALDGDWQQFTPAERQAFGFAKKLTATSQKMTDADIAGLQKHFSDPEVAEIIQSTCVANMFDRFTETLNLALEQ